VVLSLISQLEVWFSQEAWPVNVKGFISLVVLPPPAAADILTQEKLWRQADSGFSWLKLQGGGDKNQEPQTSVGLQAVGLAYRHDLHLPGPGRHFIGADKLTFPFQD
jgi:hypothetical protein